MVYQVNQPENALTSPWQIAARPVVQTFLPEQWAFFTKSPREEVLTSFSETASHGWQSSSLFPHSRADHAFGWNRVSRAQGVEIGLISAGLKKTDWRKCPASDGSLECVGRFASSADASREKVENASLRPTLCGPTAIAKIKPDPWAWRVQGLRGEEKSVAFLEVQC
ncbi:SdpA family antimicrobial peptide system protein [Frondihabitans sp. PAMC 28766]|uniref:SdpA family antimicrobial peptide system protein n=1 Tax=Frondihabitans sp. PAMC 28766 TaxID=1795630 RepID=UPI0012FF6221|nr:SdpA family antimicrobial peptide system protein [Frondihabitans sp. PAMC 28766]